MWNKSKIFCLLVVWLSFFITAIPNVFSQDKFPVRPMTFLIPFGAGGSTDIMFRPLLDAASKIIRQPLVVVNKPGASGTLAPASMKTSKPDGYTLSSCTNNLMIVSYMEDVGYDPLKDFTYIIRIYCSTFGIAVKSDSPWKTLKDLVEYAKLHPNEIKYSTSSPGGPHHFAMEDIARKEGIKWNIVPYPSGNSATMALLGGHVQVTSQDSSWAPQYHAGQIRILATFGDERSSYLPNVPSLKELGYRSWSSPNGVAGPANMDKGVVKILHDAFKKAMTDPIFTRTLESMLISPCYLNTDDYNRYVREVSPTLREAVRMVGLEKKK
jgi:tripartite-type tricarboxylate transporter receptor subunit TctC